jgi:hypothetical protein
MYKDFLTFTVGARNNQPYCNSVCEAKVQLNALVIYWKAYYNQIVVGGAGLGAVTPSGPAPAPVVKPALPVIQPRVINPLYNRSRYR